MSWNGKEGCNNIGWQYLGNGYKYMNNRIIQYISLMVTGNMPILSVCLYYIYYWSKHCTYNTVYVHVAGTLWVEALDKKHKVKSANNLCHATHVYVLCTLADVMYMYTSIVAFHYVMQYVHV